MAASILYTQGCFRHCLATRVKPFLLVTGLQSGSSTNSGGGGTQSTSSNLSQHLTYTSYILKQTPQVSGVSILAEADQHFRLQW